MTRAILDTPEAAVLDLLADNDWHPWLELGERLGKRDLGRELVIAGVVQQLRAEGVLLYREADRCYRLPRDAARCICAEPFHTDTFPGACLGCGLLHREGG